MEQITLTGKQIMELALFSGLVIDEKNMDESLLDTEYELMHDEVGIEIKCEDGIDDPEKYTHVVFITEYPEEGTLPLGDRMSD